MLVMPEVGSLSVAIRYTVAVYDAEGLCVKLRLICANRLWLEFYSSNHGAEPCNAGDGKP